MTLAEIKNIIEAQYEYTKKLITENMHYLESIANKLLDKETIDEKEFNECFDK